MCHCSLLGSSHYPTARLQTCIRPVLFVPNTGNNTCVNPSNQLPCTYLNYCSTWYRKTYLSLMVLLIWSPLTTSVTSIQSSAVVQATKQHFGRHGIPRTLLMDNGSQYTSDLFKEFTKAYKFDHITSLLVTIQIWTSCKVS